MRNLLIPFIALALALAACDQQQAPETEQQPVPEVSEQNEKATPDTATETTDADLDAILAAQPEEAQARYPYRHPKETIEFFGIEPGMTVVEALPGGGWYTKILLPYLGSEGHLIGVDYPLAMWSEFGFFDDKFIEGKKIWASTWTEEAKGWRGANGPEVSAFVFGAMPEEMAGTADAVLFIRALHNLARFESNGGYLTTALSDAYNILKPGGIVGVVQHHARDEMPDEWADGSRGYLKKGFVIDKMKEAGFELVAENDINANPQDQPTEEDIVWRLPPSLNTSKENPELREQMQAIGESNRMTLLFRKPESE